MQGNGNWTNTCSKMCCCCCCYFFSLIGVFSRRRLNVEWIMVKRDLLGRCVCKMGDDEGRRRRRRRCWGILKETSSFSSGCDGVGGLPSSSPLSQPRVDPPLRPFTFSLPPGHTTLSPAPPHPRETMFGRWEHFVAMVSRVCWLNDTTRI